jgi:hypothetical protein
MKSLAIKKILETPEMIKEVDHYGGCLLYDKIKGGVYHCNEDEDTYYQKWSDTFGKFIIFEWQCGGLNGLDLEVIDERDYKQNC